MMNVGVIVLVLLAALAAPAFAAGPGRGLKTLPECCPGNIRDKDVKCPDHTLKCTVGGIQEGKCVKASCEKNCAVNVCFSANKEVVKFKDASDKEMTNIKLAYIKGGNGYCKFFHGPYHTPKDCGKSKHGPNCCGFSHAIFCVKP